MALIASSSPRAVIPAAILAGFAANADGPSLDFQFAKDYSLTPRKGPTLTFTRASSKTYFDAAGTLQTQTANLPCFDYDPVTHQALGLSIHEARTNSIRNNTMVGAVAGTPGTNPTNWGITAATEVTKTIVGTGTEDGITYIDVRFFGTVTAARTQDTYFEAYPGVAASNGQSWNLSTYIRIVAGSAANIASFLLAGTTYNSVPAFLSTPIGQNFTPTSAALRSQQITKSGTIADATAATIFPFIRFTTATSGAIDITLRIGMPQLELVPTAGSTASPVIATSGAAATRALEVDSTTDITWLSQTAQSFVLQARKSSVTSAGVIAQLDDGTENNRITLSVNASSHVMLDIVVGGVSKASIDGGAVTANTTFKAAFSYTVGLAALSVNGAAVVTGTPAALPTVTTYRLGENSANASVFNGWITADSSYQKALSASVLAGLSV